MTMCEAETSHPVDSILGMVSRSLDLWGTPPDMTVSLLNISENVTCLLEGSDHRFVLRVHRTGYHSERAVECELEWMTALRRDTDISIPAAIPGANGALIQVATLPETGERRMMVLFEHLDGHEAQLGTADEQHFATIGRFSAMTHRHAQGWKKPAGFERLTWNREAVFGPRPLWGDWRAAPNVGAAEKDILERVEGAVSARLSDFGTARDRFGLIHADMRLANLLVDGERIHLIDFDDCGFGWHLYDFAAAVSFIEDHPDLPDLKAAWIQGYREVSLLPPEHEGMIDTLVMLRRLALLAWIGSHIDAPEPQALAPDFARISAILGEEYLRAHP